MTTFRILSIDGGGIKGIYPASVLAEIEETTGKSMADHFDLIAGTSTGGIIALALGLGVPAKEILTFYKANAALIFPTTGRLRLWLRGLLRAKYDSAPLRKALEPVFGARTLGEARTRLLVPSMSASTGDVYIYKTPHHERFKTDHKRTAVEVALSTSAAPTYFPAHRTTFGVDLLDGGLWANNPLMVAVVEALSYLKQQPQNIRVLSIGCTATPIHAPASALVGGKAQWALRAIDWFGHGQSISAVNQASLLLGKDSVIRIQQVMPDGAYELDAALAALRLEGPGREAARQKLSEVQTLFLEQPRQSYVPLYR